MPTRHKRSWVLLTGFAACTALATMPITPAAAVEPSASVHNEHENAQSLYLIKLLESSSQFRVRAQAAISLGMMEQTSATRRALAAALRDAHPAVRAAAATSLGRVGDANHVIALRTLEGDPEGPVRTAARASIGRIESAREAAVLAIQASHVKRHPSCLSQR